MATLDCLVVEADVDLAGLAHNERVGDHVPRALGREVRTHARLEPGAHVGLADVHRAEEGGEVIEGHPEEAAGAIARA